MLHYHGVEIICDEALAGLNFTNFTCPPLVTTITEGMLTDCKCMFSVEIPEHVTHIRSIAFLACHSLHNVAFVVAEIIEGAFLGCTDLLHVFGTAEAIIHALMNRFTNSQNVLLAMLQRNDF